MKRISIPKTSKLTAERKSLQSGFTLTEVLIAVAISALMISVATIALGDNERAKLKTKARQFYGLLQVAQEESIFRGIELGVRVRPQGYSFMIYNGGTWQPLQDHRLLRAIEFDEPMRAAINLQGQQVLLQNESAEEATENGGKGDAENQASAAEEAKDLPEPPQIYMLSSGEMNDFVVTIGLEREEPVFYRIQGNYVGEITLSNAIPGHYRHDWDLDLEVEDDD